MQHTHGWRRVGERYLFESKWYNLRQDDLVLPTGETITYTFIEHPGGVLIVPLLSDGRVVMECIYRHPLQRTILACPAGGLDGEAPLVAAARELEEETGYCAGLLTPLGQFISSAGVSNETYDVFLATDLTDNGRVQRECTEQIDLVLIPLDDLHHMVVHGNLHDAPSCLAILLAWEKIHALSSPR